MVCEYAIQRKVCKLFIVIFTMSFFALALLILLVQVEQSLSYMDRLSELSIDEAKEIKNMPSKEHLVLAEREATTSKTNSRPLDKIPNTAEETEIPIQQDFTVISAGDLTGNPDSVYITGLRLIPVPKAKYLVPFEPRIICRYKVLEGIDIPKPKPENTL